MHERIAVIPARSGSKRIVDKNIKDFYGKPIIAWSIQVAQETNLFSKIIVSTDSKKIADLAIKFGAEVPFIRPKKLSGDHVGTIDVISHAITKMTKKDFQINDVCCIYAASPLIKSDDIKKSYDIFHKEKWLYSFPVTEFEYPIYRSFMINNGKKLKMIYPEHFNTRSQDLKKVYHDAGQFYWGTKETWLSKKIFFDDYSYPYIIPKWRVQDIDTLDDWKRAHHLFKLIKGK